MSNKITIDKAVLEQALDALKKALPITREQSYAIISLREALAQPAAQQEPSDWNRSIRDSVDSLLCQAGFDEDSSVRHQLAMMNFDKPPQQPAQQEPAGEPVCRVCGTTKNLTHYPQGPNCNGPDCVAF